MPFEDQRLLDAFDEDERNYGINLANQKLENFIENILKPILPNYESSLSTMSGYYPNSAELLMSTFCNSLKGSQFYYPKNTSDFIHFTNIKNARNIITEECIYLSGLNTSTDKNEIELNLQAFEKQSDSWNKISTDVKANFLNFSLSPFLNDVSFLNKSFSNFQHNYFQFGGDFPVGLVIEIDLNDRDDWWCFHLSKVHYSEGDNHPPVFLKNFVAQCINWCNKSGFSINNLPHVIFPLLAFFKENKYEIENEVRLIKAPMSSNDQSSIDGPLFSGYSINSRNQLVKIHKLFLDGPRKLDVFERTFQNPQTIETRLRQIPKIKLKKILLPTIEFESLALKNTFNTILTSLNLDVEVSYIEFNSREKSIEIF